MMMMGTMMVIGIRMMIGLMMMMGTMMVIGIRMMIGLMIMMGTMMSLVATFLYHSAPVPLPPLRPLGHGGDF